MSKRLRFRAGDRVRVVKAQAFARLVGRDFVVLHVGPWKAGDRQPNGLTAGWDCDYILGDDEDGLACRDDNLEAA